MAREGSVYSAAATSDASGSAAGSFAALRAKGMPDLRNAKDISDYVLNHGELGFLSSASEAESDASGGEEDPVTGENSKQITLPSAYMGRANKKIYSDGPEKRAVRLAELGPRMELGLVKIEDGVGDGKGDVLFHEFIHKTPKEAADIARRAKEREKLAKSRRAEQEANVRRKKEEKEAKAAEKQKRKEEKQKAGSGAAESSSDEAEGSEIDEFEYEDMFQEPDQDVKDKADSTAADADGADLDDDAELFDEGSEDEEEQEGRFDEEDEDDSDLSPIPYNSGDDDDEFSEDDQRPVVSTKKARFQSSNNARQPHASAGTKQSKRGGKKQFGRR